MGLAAKATWQMLAFGGWVLAGEAALAGDYPLWGGPTRNMVSGEKGLPDSLDRATGRNVKWSAALGTETYSTPIIASGRVFIGTNNDRPRDPAHKTDCGVLMCFDEKDGRFLWQLTVPKRGPSAFLDWPHTGLVSPVTVEGDRVYLVSNRNEVMCLDIEGLANGNQGPFMGEGVHMAPPGQPAEPVNPTDADILWVVDMTEVLDVHPHDAAHCSLLPDGDYLYACTSNGVDDTHNGFPKPDAPALAVFDKRTGRLVAHDDEKMGGRTIHCTWSSPSTAEIGGRPLLFFAGGDGVCYAFEKPTIGSTSGPARLQRVWRFDCDPAAPKEDILKWQDNRREGPSNIMGMPVIHDRKVYVAAGGDLWHGKPKAWLQCIDATKTGDITATGEVWSYALRRHCMATPTVANGLVFIGDCGRQIHCVDAATGKGCWTHDARDEVWASALVADGKVYIATRGGTLWVFAADREKKLIASTELEGPINGCPVAANGTLYIATMTHLYAIAEMPAK